MATPKNIYKGKEVPYYEEFMALQEGLTKEFFNVYPDFGNMPMAPSYMPTVFRQYDNAMLVYDVENMPDFNAAIKGFDRVKKHTAKYFPTAFNEIINKYPGVVMACYGLLKPGGIIGRHTGPENRSGQWIRIHIPLVIPEGDVGFEVAGEVVLWDDLFAFNNQRLHSAWNLTDKPRLIFIFDIPRSVLNLLPGIPWADGDNDLNDTERTPPFLKTQLDFSEETLDPILREIKENESIGLLKKIQRFLKI